jgi:succinate dehydrogenase flavin-adding protein (antitoxin of CptAB toxin-antitoxin module)
MTQRTINIEYNTEIIRLLSERDDVLATFFDLRHADDEQLKNYTTFVKRYAELPQIDRDIFYLCTTITPTRTAKLLQVSGHYIRERYEELCKELLHR